MVVTAGVTLGRQSSVLVDRALDLLAAGPADARTVVATVCQLPAVAGSLADHLAVALLGADDRFTRRADGLWHLAPFVAGGTGAAAAQWSEPATALLEAESFMVVDVEATGTKSNGGDRVVEVAAVHVRGGIATTVFDTLVNPGRPVPRYITSLTRITTDMVRRAPAFEDIAAQLAGVLEGHVFVAHNVGFDWRFLSSEIQRVTGRPLIGRRLCTVKLARKLLPFLRRRSLDVLSAHFGVENHARHRAGGDAAATAKVFLRLLDQARAAGCSTLDDVEALIHPGVGGRRKKKKRRPSALPQPVEIDPTL
jgi:DNA polymerase-3 subunit epsilon